MVDCPTIDPASALQFVINGAAGSSDADGKRAVIEAALQAGGRRGELLFSHPAELAGVAHQAAAKAIATRTAVVAVGGDGTLNTVAQAAHAVGCAMGVVPQGTFNYFARTHGLPADPAEATRLVLNSVPVPVQVAAVNDRVFLVNASLGLYPDLLEDREAFKARFGRSRWVALWSAAVTLLRAQRRLRLRILQGASAREVRTLTLFVGNNQLQLEQLGLSETGTGAEGSTSDGQITAVILKPVGALAMIGLMLRGALGQLGEADSIERIVCPRLVITPSNMFGSRTVKVAYDGEVSWMNAPLTLRVLPEPLWLLKAGSRTS